MRLLFLLGLSLFFSGCGEKREKVKVGEEPIGYSGAAKRNPYLAAERYLEAKGHSVANSRSWSNFDYETSVIFMPASFLQTRGMALRVLDWIDFGGTLVLTIEGGEADRNDFVNDDWYWSYADDEEYSGLSEILEVFDITIDERGNPSFETDQVEEKGHLSRPWEVSRFDQDGADLALEFEGSTVMSIGSGWEWIPSIGGGSRMVGASYGAGEIIVMAHARPLRNPYLARADHAAFLDYLAARYGSGQMVFLYGSSTSFFGLLWKDGWMVVIAAVCVLLAWLWMRIPRFGPVLLDREVKRVPYGDALTTSARFLWRTGEIESLVRPLRERLEHESGSDPETFYDRLAEESGIEREEVVQVLTGEIPRDPGQTLKMVEKLQRLLKR
ncbi:MAG: hypothetical protein PVJ98_02485 [Akkermansiaceae bacterium]|jgi:hypothetical protein